MENSITRRAALKGSAAAATAVTTRSAMARDTSDLTIMEAMLAEIGRLEHQWLEITRAADIGHETESDWAQELQECAWALGDELAAYPITSPQGALFKAEAICSGVGPMFRDAWPMMPQHVEAMQHTLRDWLARQVPLTA